MAIATTFNRAQYSILEILTVKASLGLVWSSLTNNNPTTIQPMLVTVEHRLAAEPVVTASTVGAASGIARKDTFTASKTVA